MMYCTLKIKDLEKPVVSNLKKATNAFRILNFFVGGLFLGIYKILIIGGHFNYKSNM